MAIRVRFGPAGKPVQYKGAMLGVPEFLHGIGLDALEYQAVRGVRISEPDATALGEEAKKYDVALSLHAPYFINLAGSGETIEKSIERLVQSAKAAEWMGARPIVFHAAYYGKKGKEGALRSTIEALRKAVELCEAEGVERPAFSPETMGRDAQLGTIDEVLAVCSEVPGAVPTVDWAHIHARGRGSLKTVGDVLKVIEQIEKVDPSYLKPLHTHFTKVEFGAGGEKKHHTLDEEGYGPDFSIVAKALIEAGVDAVVISESPILEVDGLKMKETLAELLEDA